VWPALKRSPAGQASAWGYSTHQPTTYSGNISPLHPHSGLTIQIIQIRDSTGTYVNNHLPSHGASYHMLLPIAAASMRGRIRGALEDIGSSVPVRDMYTVTGTGTGS
jgi:hypothetical protein